MKVRRAELSLRRRRQLRIRRTINGTPECPRMNVFCSLRYIYAQVIDDTTGRVLASANSMGKKWTGEGSRANVAAAKEVGKRVAQAALDAKIKRVVFDRAGYQYHGKVKALADAAREVGLQL